MKVYLLRDKSLRIAGVYAANSENQIPPLVLTKAATRGYSIREYHPVCPRNDEEWETEIRNAIRVQQGLELSSEENSWPEAV